MSISSSGSKKAWAALVAVSLLACGTLKATERAMEAVEKDAKKRAAATEEAGGLLADLREYAGIAAFVLLSGAGGYLGAKKLKAKSRRKRGVRE